MEYAAIHHDMDKRYCYALEKNKFLIRLQTKKDDMKSVVLHYQDKYLPIKYYDSRRTVSMEKAASDRLWDYYEAVVEFEMVCLRYFFELTDTAGEAAYYSNYEFFKEEVTDIDRMFDCPQNLREEERFVIPDWARNKVVYQIFPSSFASSRVVEEEQWYKAPMCFGDHLPGNLRGIMEKLPHLAELGVEVIYMTPIFMSDSPHKYDTKDYYHIDPSFGTNEELHELVEKAHGMGIRVILDGVFNHTSRHFFAFEDVQKYQEDSRYRDWYFIKEFPVSYVRGEKPKYKCFAYFGGMPKLNLRNPEVEEYFIGVGRYWLENYQIDGWRMDVGDEISHRFWKRFREAMKEVNPEALIIGEIWHHAGDFLEGDEWDSIMNYSFCHSVQDFVVKERISASEFLGSLEFMRGRNHVKVYPVLLNLIDSHDTPRFLHTCGEDKRKLRLAAALQLLMPGMPMIYYGDEYGMTGGMDPDCRRGMLWKEERQDLEIYQWYRRLIRIRKSTCFR